MNDGNAGRAMALTKTELEKASCDSPGCTHLRHGPLYLHGRCHPSAGTRVSYSPGSGELSIHCRSCKALIVRVAVAP